MMPAAEAINWAEFWDGKSRQETDFQATGRSVMDISGFLYLVRDCVRALDPQPTDKVLDIGCGSGIVALALAPHVSHIHACDISEGMIERAKRNLDHVENVTLSVGSITDSGQPSMAYDKVLCYSVIQYLADENELHRAFDELHRVLKPGGRAFVAANPDLARKAAYLATVDKHPDLEARALNRKVVERTLWLTPAHAVALAQEHRFEAVATNVHPRIWQTFYMFDLSLQRAD